MENVTFVCFPGQQIRGKGQECLLPLSEALKLQNIYKIGKIKESENNSGTFFENESQEIKELILSTPEENPPEHLMGDEENYIEKRDNKKKKRGFS
jgi:hypothetical protein